MVFRKPSAKPGIFRQQCDSTLDLIKKFITETDALLVVEVHRVIQFSPSRRFITKLH